MNIKTTTVSSSKSNPLSFIKGIMAIKILLRSRSGDHVMHPLERLEHLESLKPLKPSKPHEDHVTYPKPIASSSNDENGCICR